MFSETNGYYDVDCNEETTGRVAETLRDQIPFHEFMTQLATDAADDGF